MPDSAPLFPSFYCPPITYFAQLAKYNNVVIEQYETFPKQTYRNHTVISSANGLLSLSVPTIRTHGNHTMTCDMGISYAEHWNIKHWRAIESAYSAAPYFLYYRDNIEEILLTPHDRLLQLNHLLLAFFLKKLKIDCHLDYSDNFTPIGHAEHDYRNAFPSKTISAAPLPPYEQVFATKFPFQSNLSILDLLFNMGPDAKRYLSSL